MIDLTRDPEFDTLLVELLLRDKRDYAARRWKAFKDSKGIYPPPSFETDASVLLALYRARVEAQGFDVIFSRALEQLSKYSFVERTVPKDLQDFYTKILTTNSVKDKVKKIVDELSESLSKQLAGATLKTISAKTHSFKNSWREDQRKTFLAFMRDSVQPQSSHDIRQLICSLLSSTTWLPRAGAVLSVTVTTMNC